MSAVRVLRALTGLALTALLVTAAQAQDKTTGALRGKVTAAGEAVPGLTVTIESGSMLGKPRTVLTDASGEYRFQQIPPGTYKLIVNGLEYKTKTVEGVKVSVGLTTSYDLSVMTEGGEETINVEGALPQIDVTSAATSTTLPQTYLDNIPAGRFQPDTLNLAPGINLDSAFGGGSSSANAYQIDGVDVSDPDGGTPWSFVNYNIIDEVQLVGLGAPAEYGGFTGVVFNSTTKSGSNQVKGDVNLYYTGESLTAKNVPGNVDIQPPTIKKSWDFSFQLGGPIKQDTLWYFVSAQSYGLDSSDGGPLRTERSPRLFAKVDWQVDSRNQLTTWVEWDKYDITGRGGNADTPLEATVTEDAPEYVWNVGWKNTLSPNTIFNATLQGYTGYYYLDPAEGYDKPGLLNENGDGKYSQNSTFFYLADRDRNQLNVSLTHHSEQFLNGSHDFKFGAEIERSTLRSRYGYTTGKWIYIDASTNDDPGTPEVDDVYYTTYYYGNDYDVSAKDVRLSLYAQDSWQMTSTFTLNPGLRLDINRGKIPGSTPLKNEPLALRLGFAWDLTGDGKSLLKGHYGRYYEALFGSHFYRADQNAFHAGSSKNVFPSGASIIFPADPTRVAVDDKLDHPYVDQFLVGFDREIFAGVTFSASAVYRKNKDFIETVSRDGTFERITGFVPIVGDEDTPSSQRVTLFNYTSDPSADTLLITNPGGLFRKYKGVILTATKRLQNNWQALLSYVWSKSTGNINNTITQNAGPSAFLDTPNSLVNAEGRLGNDPRHEVKLQGTYILPKLNLWLSGDYVYHSGQTYTRTSDCLLVSDDGGGFTCFDFAQGNVRYFADPRGTSRLPPRNTLDLRAEWKPRIKDGTLGVIVDVFNVFNRGVPVDARTRNSGYNRPLEWSDGRNFRLGMRYNW